VIETLFVLLVVYQLKHFLADYLLQQGYMLGKFKDDWGFFLPLLSHAGVHGIFTLIICLIINPSLWWLSLVDLVVHFIMDRVKAGKKYLGRFKALSASEFPQVMAEAYHINKPKQYHVDCGYPPSAVDKAFLMVEESRKKAKNKLKHNKYFWISLGFDQMVHHLTNYYIIWMLVT